MNTQQLTFTRFVAAILIVIYHFGNNIFPFNEKFIAPLIHNAHFGVNYFFILSGFVMIVANSKMKKIEYGNYLQNRAARILPLYYFALLLMLVYFFVRIYLLAVPSRYYPSVVDVLLNIFLIQTWIPGNSTQVNTAAWSLSAEAFFYVLFPLFFNKLYLFVKLNFIIVFCLFFFVISQISISLLTFNYPDLIGYFMYNPLLRINEFIIGNIIGFLFLRKNTESHKSISYLAFLFVLSLMIIYTKWIPLGLHNSLFVLIFATAVYLLSIDGSVISKFLRKRVFVHLGEISYGIYILQFPVYFFFTASLSYFGFKINQPLFYVYLILLIALSFLAFNYIERPMREFIRNLRFK